MPSSSKLIYKTKRHMKRLWLFSLCVISCSVFGQPTVKIYAWSQITTPGTIPAGVTDESGKHVNIKTEPSVNYFIFGVYPVSSPVIFEEVWIKNKYYHVQTNKVDSTPVVNINYNIPNNLVKVILVPATKLRVTSISPVEAPRDTLIKTSSFKNMARHSELIISYQYNGKRYFTGVKKIKTLSPIAGL
jgi:hypothetical protein